MKERKILVVDDEKDIRELIGMMLQTDDCDVSTAADGEQALEMALAQKYDLIITDVFMPRLDGLELVRRLKEEQTPNTNTPTIFISAADRYVNSTLEMGEFLPKPFAIDDLLSLTDRVLHDHQI